MTPSHLTTHRRRSLRLREYDYSQAGAYFVTICTQDGAPLFGTVTDGQMNLNGAGEMIQAVWETMPAHYSDLEIDAFVVMPNHVHMILVFLEAGPVVAPPVELNTGGKRFSLPDAVQRFKSLTTRRYSDGVKHLGWPRFSGRLWQRNYYEHVIRTEATLSDIRQYIADNPTRWLLDHENPDGRRRKNNDPEGRGQTVPDGTMVD